MVKTFRPQNLNEALRIRSDCRTTVFAGGSDLMVQRRVWRGVEPRLAAPPLFIAHLPELREIRVGKNGVHIGACCTLAQILEHRHVPDRIKLPLSGMASPSIRNIATIGGNIANASPAADTLPMLYSLDALLTLQSRNRTDTLGIADFITGPGRTALQEDQIVTRISIPLADFNCMYYEKVGARRANCISKLSFYALARLGGSRVEEARIGFGAVAPTVVRSPEAESLLTMTPTSRIPERLEEMRALYFPIIQPIDDMRSTVEYRQGVAFALLERFLLEVASGKYDNRPW